MPALLALICRGRGWPSCAARKEAPVP